MSILVRLESPLVPPTPVDPTDPGPRPPDLPPDVPWPPPPPPPNWPPGVPWLVDGGQNVPTPHAIPPYRLVMTVAERQTYCLQDSIYDRTDASQVERVRGTCMLSYGPNYVTQPYIAGRGWSSKQLDWHYYVKPT